MRIRTTAVALLAIAALSGCAAPEPAEDPCPAVIRQAAYEAMRQLAAGGLAADPGELRRADARAIVRDSDEPEVVLPAFEQLVEYSDADRTQLLSALSSELVGVGATFDQDAFFSSLDASGACAGRLDAR